MRSSAHIVCLALLAMAGVLFAAEPQAPKVLPEGVRSIATTHIHNAFKLSTNVFSGSSPDDDAAFAELARLGIKTLISVDGGTPNVELAHKYGMRYIHLPHGYDGIDASVQAQLAKAAQLSSEPVFVHCHHGLHRGPAAAAIICMANGGWSTAVGEAWLRAAGTGTNYTGLYASVRKFEKPTDEQMRALPNSFSEVAKVSGLIDAMVGIDQRWDHLKAVRKAGYQTSKDHPDIDPAHEAVLLWEHYREAQRLPDAAKQGARMVELLQAAETEARRAEELLRAFATAPESETRLRLDKTFDAIGQSCASCHQAYRDKATPTR